MEFLINNWQFIVAIFLLIVVLKVAKKLIAKVIAIAFMILSVARLFLLLT